MQLVARDQPPSEQLGAEQSTARAVRQCVSVWPPPSYEGQVALEAGEGVRRTQLRLSAALLDWSACVFQEPRLAINFWRHFWQYLAALSSCCCPAAAPVLDALQLFYAYCFMPLSLQLLR